jgi:cytidylate kinase
MDNFNYPKIVIFGGPGRSGESTLAKKFASNNGFDLISGGDYMRKIALEAGFTRDPNYVIPSDPSLYNLDMADTRAHRNYARETHRDIDFETDVVLVFRMLQALQENGRQITVESKVMARLLHTDKVKELITLALKVIDGTCVDCNEALNTFRRQGVLTEIDKRAEGLQDEILANHKAVWIDASPEAKAERSLRKLFKIKHKISNGPEAQIDFSYTQEELSAEIANIAERQLNDGFDYSKVYGMEDYPKPGTIPSNDLYGYCINNTNQSEAESYEAVCAALSLPLVVAS